MKSGSAKYRTAEGETDVRSSPTPVDVEQTNDSTLDTGKDR